MTRLAALALGFLAACGPRLVWHGKSPDREHVVRIVEHHGQFVVLDGVRGPTYDAIAPGALAFRPDGRGIAYAARRGGTWRVITDGREGPPFKGINELTYSPDGAHLAYAAFDGRGWRMVIDGREGPVFDALLDRTLTFSSDGARVAYAGTRADGAHVVVDGVAGPAWTGVGSLAFSADGRRVGYLARRGLAAHAVIDGVPGERYEAIGELVLSPRGGRAGFLGLDRAGWHLVVDGVVGPAWELARGLAFSDDGAHVAYVARRAARDTFVITDGVEGTSFTGVRPTTVAFHRGHASPTYTARRGDLFLVVHDGKEGPPFDDVRPTIASPGGTRWGYVGRRDAAWIPVIDGTARAPERWASDPVFSADDKRVAYSVRRGSRMAVIVDGAVHAFDLVMDGTLMFDATGRHWGCVAGTAATREFHVVIDGVPRERIEIAEVVDAAIRNKDAGNPVGADRTILHDWVAAELVRSTR